MVVACWKPGRAVDGFAGAGRDAAALDARLAAGAALAEAAAGFTGRGGLNVGPLRRTGAAFGGIVVVRLRGRVPGRRVCRRVYVNTQ